MGGAIVILSLVPTIDGTDESMQKNLTRGFHLLRVKRRRQVIWRVALLGPDKEITVREISKEIAAAEQGIPSKEVTNDEYRPVYNGLTQDHLYTLEEANVIGYDDRAKVITPGPNIEALGVLIAVAVPLFQLLLSQEMGE